MMALGKCTTGEKWCLVAILCVCYCLRLLFLSNQPSGNDLALAVSGGATSVLLDFAQEFRKKAVVENTKMLNNKSVPAEGTAVSIRESDDDKKKLLVEFSKDPRSAVGSTNSYTVSYEKETAPAPKVEQAIAAHSEEKVNVPPSSAPEKTPKNEDSTSSSSSSSLESHKNHTKNRKKHSLFLYHQSVIKKDPIHYNGELIKNPTVYEKYELIDAKVHFDQRRKLNPEFSFRDGLNGVIKACEKYVTEFEEKVVKHMRTSVGIPKTEAVEGDATTVNENTSFLETNNDDENNENEKYAASEENDSASSNKLKKKRKSMATSTHDKYGRTLTHSYGAHFSELLAFSSIALEDGVTHIIESGMANGVSTEILARFFENKVNPHTNKQIEIISCDLDQYGIVRKTVDRLQPWHKFMRFMFRDIFKNRGPR